MLLIQLLRVLMSRMTTNNTLTSIFYNRNDVPLHTNTNGFAISRLKWDGVVNNSGTTGYSDFKKY
jgi:hypothetical protein